MKKTILLLSSIFCFSFSFSQTATSVPDSAKNVALPGSGPQPVWNISNPLNHNGTSFGNPPINVAFNSRTDYAYFYDFGFNIPAGNSIDGIKVLWNRGGCNGGSSYDDTLHLAHNGAIISNEKSGSEPGTVAADSAGGPTDVWGATLTQAMVNDNSFGVFYNMRDSGICTFSVSDLRLTIYYSNGTGNDGEITKTITIYPNPASDVLNVSFNERNSKWILYNSTGIEILRGEEKGENFEIDVHSLPAGFYFLETTGKQTLRKKIIVE